jgi:hypothetical protein
MLWDFGTLYDNFDTVTNEIAIRVHNFTTKTEKGYSSPATGLEWPRGFQEVKVPRFLDNGTGWW